MIEVHDSKGLPAVRSAEPTRSVQRQTSANPLYIFGSMPTKTRLRRRLFVIIATVAVSVLGLSAPASAAPATPGIAVTIGATSVTPGQTVSITVQFTNTQSTDVNFTYESLSPDWPTSNETGLDFAFQSCSGNDSWCDLAGKTVEWYDNPPIAPGASQTVTLTYEVLPDSACGTQTIGFTFYDYDEYNSDTNNEGATFDAPPSTTVNCA
ncbi:MAG TPA: hypothetical protein VG247_33415 [Pseudonocardiaceae bacterium]|nr:hypothetical protein [Pseudonocardiaceae bacterium]